MSTEEGTFNVTKQVRCPYCSQLFPYEGFADHLYHCPSRAVEIPRYTKDTTLQGTWGHFQKKTVTQAQRIKGPFYCETQEGVVRCEDGWLALDADGWPYPIADEVFQKTYVEVLRVDLDPVATNPVVKEYTYFDHYCPCGRTLDDVEVTVGCEGCEERHAEGLA